MNGKRNTFLASLLAVGLSFVAVPVTSAQITHSTDVKITGSVCAGFDCTSSESFGFDTLRLKENNLRIHFNDTSTSASFPGNDWRIVINDSSNGGANYFAVEDSTAGRQPFRIEAGAIVNALYVDNEGDVGIGTSNPVVELHAVDGNTPTMRLEQDGSNGFTAQTWDLAGNETNFFIRDVTGGSKLPFRIKPGAPTDSLFVAANGSVGVGTETPRLDNRGIHVKSATDTTAGSVGIGVDARNSAAGGNCALNLQYGPPQGHTFITARPCSNNERIRMFVGNVERMTLNTTGVNIAGNLTISGGNCSDDAGGGGCTPDYVFKPGYELESIEEHAESMWANSHLPSVGKGSKDGSFEITKTTWGILEELEKAHIYIDQLNDQLRQKTGEIEQLKAETGEIQELKDRLARLEFALLNGNQASADD